jgi:hypothetical protein
VCCASAGAGRPECGICAGPAYVVIPQGKKRKKKKRPEFLGLYFILFTISPRRAKLGGVTRGMRSAGAPPPNPADGAPPAGPWQELIWQFALQRLVGTQSPLG